MKIQSKKELDEETSYTLLPHEDYKINIVEVKEDRQPKYKAVPDENGVVEQEDIVNVSFEIISYKDGGEAKDEEDEPAKGRKVFFTGRPKSMGYMRDGTPAKTRCLVAYATEQDVDEEMVLDSWQDLVGKTIYAEIIQKENTKGKTTNRIARFVLPPRKNTAEMPEGFLQNNEVEE